MAAPGSVGKAGAKTGQQAVQQKETRQQPGERSASAKANHFNIPLVPSGFEPVSRSRQSRQNRIPWQPPGYRKEVPEVRPLAGKKSPGPAGQHGIL